ncbi:MAG: (Fe-S)-binding protein, partial [Propionibacteriaceae bacterium]|nr:(Fe-S)-binding protein [Propionibacteriaceae bacterium]
GGRSRRRPQPAGEPDAVYLPGCLNAMFGPETRDQLGHPVEGREGVQAAVEALCARAGLTLLVPDGIDDLCCATPWTSKGMTRGRDAMSARVVDAVRAASDNGRLPIICDAASCTEGYQRILADEPDLTVIDVVQFVAERVLGHLDEVSKVPSITLHQTCSSTHIGLNPYLVTVAHAVADKVNVPVDGGCCAFAGDRGMLHPELTASATRAEAAEVAELGATVHASVNRTCEIGMSRATHRPYRHILEVLADQVQ